jgi:hypothetical protein
VSALAKKKASTTAGGGENKPMKKADAVREIMASGVNDIKEIQRQVKDKYGIDVAYNNIYVLLKKGTSKSSGKGGRGGRRKAAAASIQDTKLGAFASALSFIRAAGGIEQAKSVLQTIEEIKSL